MTANREGHESTSGPLSSVENKDKYKKHLLGSSGAKTQVQEANVHGCLLWREVNKTLLHC